MTNHESIKLLLGFTLALVTGFVFFKFKSIIVSVFGSENYYFLLAYSAVVPPYLLNKSYDSIVRELQSRAQKKLAKGISDEMLSNEGQDFRDLVASMKDDKRDKIKKFKDIENSKRTL